MSTKAAAEAGLEPTESVSTETETGLDFKVVRDAPIVVGVEAEIIVDVFAILVIEATLF